MYVFLRYIWATSNNLGSISEESQNGLRIQAKIIVLSLFQKAEPYKEYDMGQILETPEVYLHCIWMRQYMTLS